MTHRISIFTPSPRFSFSGRVVALEYHEKSGLSSKIDTWVKIYALDLTKEIGYSESMKNHNAKLILIQLEALAQVPSDKKIAMTTLVNEILRDAKELAEEVLDEEQQQEKAA